MDLGSTVSRTLDPRNRQFSQVVWQVDKPPMDAEFNLQAQIDSGKLSVALTSAGTQSGFFSSPMDSLNDFTTDALWSNLFTVGTARDPILNGEASEETAPLLANVNGWIIPLAGTNSTDLRNFVKLNPPPETGGRTDLVYLEVWQALVSANPSTANKPSASTVYKYGNVDFGGTNLTDDLTDPNIRFETTKRVQTQYRLSVFGSGVTGINLSQYPEGLGDPNLLGRGTSTTPVGGMVYTNMRTALGDAGLYRAGDGDPTNDLGTVDGYVYAVPVAAVFRRNSAAYDSVLAAGTPNQNGAFNRNPGAYVLSDPTEASRILLQATLTSALSATAVGAISVTHLNGSGLEDTSLDVANTYLVIDGEIIAISSISVGGSTVTIPADGRGRYGSAASGHVAGSSVNFYNDRPDGLFADSVSSLDILDLKHCVTLGEWDYHQLLEASLGALFEGSLRTAWKQSNPGVSRGAVIHEVAVLNAAAGTTLNNADMLDGPDGVRTVWSDAAVIQPDVTLLLDNEAVAVDNFLADVDATVSWDVGPDFKPDVFLNQGSLSGYWTNGSSIFLYTGGSDGTEGARGTFRDGATRAVRVVTPREQHRAGLTTAAPVSLRMAQSRAHEPPSSGSMTLSPGPFVPLAQFNFEKPIIVLGGLLHADLQQTVPVTDYHVIAAGPTSDRIFEIDVGIDFDTAGTMYSLDADGQIDVDPSAVTMPLLHGTRTFYDLLTNYNTDYTGLSSEVYLVAYGDPDSTNNNGVFKVLGAGTTDFTLYKGSTATRVVVQAMSVDWAAVDNATGNSVTLEWRSQYTSAEDTSSKNDGVADVVVSITDLRGTDASSPWYYTSLGYGTGYDNSFPTNVTIGNKVATNQKAILSTSLLYHSGRGATGRVADSIDKVSLRSTTADYLQESPDVIDTAFAYARTVSESELSTTDVHVWNRLSSKGIYPDARVANSVKKYGGEVVGSLEIEREMQAFVEPKSKTLVLRPFRDRAMTLEALDYTGYYGPYSLLDFYSYPNAVVKDGLNIFTGATGAQGKKMGIAVPREFMPRFGRQDIPYRKTSDSTFLAGINHLFTDKSDLTSPVFNIIGGSDNTTGGNEVTTLLFVTGSGTSYGNYGTSIGAVNNVPHLGARRTDEISTVSAEGIVLHKYLNGVVSSDLGQGLRGIQMPPYYGIARLVGVYELEDFKTKGGRTITTDRTTADTDPATNLVREDACASSLFILKDGAKDLTTYDGAHTYVISDHALDLARIPGYVAGNPLSSYHYVVVCTTFGFANNWINGNNLVLVRKHNGQGVLRTDGSTFELEGVPMCIPCPAENNSSVVVGYTRTVYQGDVYGSREGASQNMSDYAIRYGEVPMASQYAMETPLVQYDTNGNFLPEVHNPRMVSILAGLDFVTSSGTGRMEGTTTEGTLLDVAVTEATRTPASATDVMQTVETQTFTATQPDEAPRARAAMVIESAEFLNQSGSDWHFNLRVKKLDGSTTTLWASNAADYAALVARPIDAADVFMLDESGKIEMVSSVENVNFGTLNPMGAGEYSKEITLTIAGVKIHDHVVINPRASNTGTRNSVVFHGWASNTDTVKIQAVTTASRTAFEPVAEAGSGNILTHTETVPQILASSHTAYNVPWVGVTPTDIIAITTDAHVMYPQATVYAYAGTDEVAIDIWNLSAAPFTMGSTTFEMTVLRETDVTAWQQVLAAQNFDVAVFRTTYSEEGTASNLADLIQGHSELQNDLSAYAEGKKVVFEAIPNGAAGNGIHLSWKHEIGSGIETPGTNELVLPVKFLTNSPHSRPVSNGIRQVTGTYLTGGADLDLSAPWLSTQIMGISERLPLGILLRDADFLGETEDRFETTVVRPGGQILLSDGVTLVYTDESVFRVFRGATGAQSDGKPLQWKPLTTTVHKGAVLYGRALLVQNFPEEAFATDLRTTEGGEIQLVVMTYGDLGVNAESPTLSVSGFGEGLAAMDRYRLPGRPMKRATRKMVNPATIRLQSVA